MLAFFHICLTEIGYISIYTRGNKLISDFCDFQCFAVVEISFFMLITNEYESLESVRS